MTESEKRGDIMTFIQSKQAYHFKCAGESLEIPAHFVGSVPDWVLQTKLFNLAVADKSITYVGHPPQVGVAEAAPAASEAAKAENAAAQNTVVEFPAGAEETENEASKEAKSGRRS